MTSPTDFARHALASLSPRTRIAYVMRHMINASDRDIAEAIHVPIDRVSRLIDDARDQLTRTFQGGGHESDMETALSSLLPLPDFTDFVAKVMAEIHKLPPHHPLKRSWWRRLLHI